MPKRKLIFVLGRGFPVKISPDSTTRETLRRVRKKVDAQDPTAILEWENRPPKSESSPPLPAGFSWSYFLKSLQRFWKNSLRLFNR